MICPRCGTRVFSAAKNCQNCGEPIPESIIIRSAEEKPKKRSRLTLRIVIAILVVVGIALILLLPKLYERVEIKTTASCWTDFNSTLLIYGEVENNTSNYVEPQFVVSLFNAGQKVPFDSYGSLIKEPFQAQSQLLAEEALQGGEKYEIREGMLRPWEKGSYLVKVESIKYLAFDSFVIKVEKKTELTPGEASTLGEAATDYSNQISGIMQKWRDDLAIAGSTSRIALSPVVAMLQEDRRKLNEIQPPSNRKILDISLKLQEGMDQVIEGFLQFMQDLESIANENILNGVTLIDTQLINLAAPIP